MKSLDERWRNEDRYTNPGPIQFYLDAKDENNKHAMTLDHMFSKQDELSEEIRGLCNSIQNDCIFAEQAHLLYAALSSLKSAKQVLNSHSLMRYHH
jgi:hypothetical protein